MLRQTDKWSLFTKECRVSKAIRDFDENLLKRQFVLNVTGTIKRHKLLYNIGAQNNTGK